MFYMYFAPRHPSGERELTAAERAEAPVVLWMTGGPGCSSEIAVLYGACVGDDCSVFRSLLGPPLSAPPS